MTDITILQDVTEDLTLINTTRIEGKISPGVKITSDDPDVDLSVLKLTPMVDIKIAGDFSSPNAQNVSIEAKNVDIEKLNNIPHTLVTDEGETIKMQGFSHITADESIVIDHITGTRDFLRKDKPAVDFNAETMTLEGKVIEGKFYPEPYTDKQLDAMPNYDGHRQPQDGHEKIDMDVLQARLDKLTSGPKISKVQVADLVKSREESQQSEENDTPSVSKNEPTEDKKHHNIKVDMVALKENLAKLTSGPKISKAQVGDSVGHRERNLAAAERAEDQQQKTGDFAKEITKKSPMDYAKKDDTPSKNGRDR